MLADVLKFLADDLDAHLQATFDVSPRALTLGSFVAAPATSKGGLFMTVVRLSALGDPVFAHRGQPTARPPENGSVEVAFVSTLSAYLDGLRMLDRIRARLHAQPVFTASAPGLPVGLERLSVQPLDLDFAAQANLWRALGAPYAPSMVYTLRWVAHPLTEDVVPPVADLG